jgi:hypothetical protein
MQSTRKQDQDFTQHFVETATIDFGDVVEYVAEECMPEDVFNEKTLERWALDNGFTREE